ncbi:MAG: hypothetical protein GX606_06555 [Elusimicrobia bacterium]|nr:hypothetical protein [Elusimicrobiota bacterium]
MRKRGLRVLCGPEGLSLVVLFLLTLLWGRVLLQDVVIAGTPDMESAFTKVAALVQSWRDGAPLGRWTPHLNFGYGYPVLNMYSPLLYYVAAGIAVLSGQIAYGLNIALLLFAFFSAVAMFFFVRRWWGAPAAFFSSVAYLFAPYRSLDVFHRGGCSESVVFLFLPLIFLCLDRFLDKPKALSFLGIAVSMAGVVLAHNLMAMLILPVALIYAIFRSLSMKRAMARGGFSLLALFCGCFLASYFVFPALWEMQFANAGRLLSGMGDYRGHFMSLGSILFANGLREPYHGGGLWAVLMGASLLLSPFFLRRDRAVVPLFIFWSVLSGLCIFMMLSYSAPVWAFLKPLALVQFSWRFFLFLSFMSSFLMASLIFFVQPKVRWALAIVGVCVVLASHYRYTHPQGGVYRQEIVDLKEWLYRARPMDDMEGLPRQVQVIALEPPKRFVEVVRGEAELIGAPVRSELRQQFVVRARTPAAVMLHLFYFPGWTVLVDGKEAKILSENPWGVILFFVPPGEHHVEVSFGHTPVRWIGEGISLFFVLVLCGVWVFRKRFESTFFTGESQG